jgi:hypothetical protein
LKVTAATRRSWSAALDERPLPGRYTIKGKEHLGTFRITGRDECLAWFDKPIDLEEGDELVYLGHVRPSLKEKAEALEEIGDLLSALLKEERDPERKEMMISARNHIFVAAFELWTLAES